MATPAFRINVRLRGELSNDQIAVIENTVPAGWEGPPLHVDSFDETFYVLDGELTFQLGDDLTTAGRGTLMFVPRGARHTFANLSAAEARYLLICTPSGFERYFDRLAAEQAGVEPPPAAAKPIPKTLVVGPRIGARPGAEAPDDHE